MKKVLIIGLTMLMVLSVSACGEKKEESSVEVIPEENIEVEQVELIPNDIKGVNISLPIDFTVKETYKDISESVDSDLEEIGFASVTVVSLPQVVWVAADCDADTIIGRDNNQSEEVTVIEYDNAATVAGKSAFTAHYTQVNNGVKTEWYMFEIFNDDGSATRIEMGFNPEENSSLQENIDAIIETIAFN